jgi:hypothetical protein
MISDCHILRDIAKDCEGPRVTANDVGLTYAVDAGRCHGGVAGWLTFFVAGYLASNRFGWESGNHISDG